MKLLYGLVVDGYGHLCVGVEGELHIIARSVLPRLLVAGQLQVLAAPVGGGRGVKDEGEQKSDETGVKCNSIML